MHKRTRKKKTYCFFLFSPLLSSLLFSSLLLSLTLFYLLSLSFIPVMPRIIHARSVCGARPQQLVSRSDALAELGAINQK